MTAIGLRAPFAFDDRDVAIDRQVGESFDAPAGLRPLDLDPVHLRGRTETEHFAHVVRGEIAAAVRLQTASREIACRPADRRAPRVAIAAGALELQAKPMVACRTVVQQHWSAAV